MNELSLIATELDNFCKHRGWRSCVIGGFAVQHWGEPRMTMDVDLSLLTGFGEEEVFVDELLRHYAGRIPDTKGFALQNRVLVIGDRVWIGYRAIILSGVTIGEGAVIGSGSVVTKDVEPFSIMVGNPARKIGERPRELVYECNYRPWIL